MLYEIRRRARVVASLGTLCLEEGGNAFSAIRLAGSRAVVLKACCVLLSTDGGTCHFSTPWRLQYFRGRSDNAAAVAGNTGLSCNVIFKEAFG